MNEEVRLPIETTKEGEKITKVCVEDIYKILNRIIESMEKAYNNSYEFMDETFKEVNGYEGYLIVGTGTSKPCSDDVYNEEIGNDIAFMKSKLNANIKKFNLLSKIWKEYMNLSKALSKEIKTISSYISMDLTGIRKFNPDYLKDIELKLNKKVY